MSIFGKDEVAMKKFSASLSVPEFSEDNFNRPKPLQLSKVAIVTTAALYRTGGDGFKLGDCLLYTSPSPRDLSTSRMPSSA